MDRPAPPNADDLLEGLNEEQVKAVTHLGGPLLIVAGAGSGKTRTLTRRFEWLVSQGVPADRILALTYTNDAAAELAERIEIALGENFDDINATTFHALCLDLLKDEAAAADLNPFVSTATQPDRIAIMLGRLSELNFHRLPLRGNPAQLIGDLNAMIDRLKEDCISPDALRDYAEHALADAADPDAREKAETMLEQSRYYAAHDQVLKDAAAIDFGGMQFELYKLLSRDEATRARIARKYDHVLVDEFQDATFVQLEILKLLTQDHRNLAAVGDDDQSIYGFRGASARSIIGFGGRFGDFTQVELELNYRSAPPIIDAARALVTQIDGDRRVQKDLTAATDKPGGVQFWRAANEVAESQAIVAEIERLIADEGVEPREICVLAKTRGNMSVLADRIAAHNLPYVLDTYDFFQRSEIRVPLSWLKVLANPMLNEDAWRMLTAPPVNLDSAEYAQLTRWMSKKKQPHILEAMRSASRNKQFAPETIDKFRVFVETFDFAENLLDELRPGEFTLRLINRVAIKGTVLLQSGANAPDRLANLSKLQKLAEAFGARRPQATAREFANYITAIADSGIEEASEHAEVDPNAVRLMTAHGSKGLEFEYVFVPGMVRSRWPGARQSDKYNVPRPLLRDPMPPLPGKESESLRAEHIEETRRLAHVAMTRARGQLVLSWFEAPTRGHKVSDFFVEAMDAVGGEEVELDEHDFETTDFIYAEMEELRKHVMGSIEKTGAQLGEMRLDAAAQTPAEFARFAELIKLSALTHRLRQNQPVSAALPELNGILMASMSPAQRSEFENSGLDARLIESEQRVEQLEQTIGAIAPRLSSFLPVTGNRLRLSASAIGQYQRCPKMYEYETVLRVPTREQSHLRLGILVHNVLERFHRDGETAEDVPEAKERLTKLLNRAIATGGWGDNDDDRQLLDRARRMIDRYAESDFARPDGMVTTEAGFQLKLPPTELMKDTPVGGKILDGIQDNGKLDRIDTAPDGGKRVVDYKTGSDSKTAAQLRSGAQSEVQLAIYKLAAADSMGLEAEGLVYYFLENTTPVIEAEATEEHVAEVRETINEVADKIISLDFTPKPEYMKCKFCAFNHVCPATEA